MANETERRFLVDPSRLPDLSPCMKYKIDQAYFETNNSGAVRVRLVDEILGYLTVKFRVGPGVNKEFEYQIPSNDAREIYTNLRLRISKIRTVLPVVGDSSKLWEIDYFSDGLMLAEIELDDIDSEIVIPEWCVKEITHLKGVSNFDMAVDFKKVREIILS